MKYEIKTEMVEPRCRPFTTKWTLEPMQDIEVDPEVIKQIQKEIQKAFE